MISGKVRRDHHTGALLRATLLAVVLAVFAMHVVASHHPVHSGHAVESSLIDAGNKGQHAHSDVALGDATKTLDNPDGESPVTTAESERAAWRCCASSPPCSRSSSDVGTPIASSADGQAARVPGSAALATRRACTVFRSCAAESRTSMRRAIGVGAASACSHISKI